MGFAESAQAQPSSLMQMNKLSLLNHMTAHRLSALQVRSCTLDTWLPDQVSFMAATGNAAANAYWEAKLAASQKPHYESTDLEPFIRRKYCNKEYAEGTWPPAAASNTTPDLPSDVGRNQSDGKRVSSSNARAKPAQHDAGAGRLEAGGFWGSLTPQESGTGRDWAPQQESAGTSDAPALLIDLMDFGADSTFQLPTTPRRTTSSSAQQMFESPAEMHARGSGLHPASNQSATTAAPAGPAVAQQRSNFALLPPPPQVGHMLLYTQSLKERYQDILTHKISRFPYTTYLAMSPEPP